MQGRKLWVNIFKALKEINTVNLQFSIHKKISFENEGEMKFFSDIQRLKEFFTSQPTVYKMLKEVLQAKRKL